MNAIEQHNQVVDSLTMAFREFFAPAGAWTVLSGVRWQPLADFPDRCYAFDAMILPSDAKLEWDESRNCFGPETRPCTVFDIVGKHNYDYDVYIDKGDDLCLAGVLEYWVWDPTAEQLRPPFRAWRMRESALCPLRSCFEGVFFSATGFRMDVRDSTVALRACGKIHIEEELLICERLLAKSRSNADHEQQTINGLTAKTHELRARLGRPTA
jgi:hypothetical protein